MQPRIINIAAYKFTPISRLKELRQSLRRFCQRNRLRGTILLAQEGINLFVAGDTQSIDKLLGRLESDEEIGPLEAKRSETAYQPFNRMLVKVKQEIIAFGVEGVAPDPQRASKIPPRELKQWIDERRDFTLLDTRNKYEIRLGTFQNAHNPRLDHFREFPAAAEGFPADWRTKPLVMFCTGGIRCEKAAPLLERMGFENVLQLDGGILKYFEEVGQQHYDGDCFVFDQRVAVDSALRETGAAQCYACQAILTEEEQQSPDYVESESCPHCIQLPEEQIEETLARRREELRRISRPLPGSQPYDNLRPVYAPANCDGMPLVEFLTTVAPAGSREWWQNEISNGLVSLAARVVGIDHRVRVGDRYDHLQPQLVEPDVNADIEILHEDPALVVVNKPAPLPMHPCGRFNKNTLSHLLGQVYHPQRLRNAHRLDANTSGVVVMTRTRRMAQRVQPQFAAGIVKKEYLARVWGQPDSGAFVCDAPIARENARAGIKLLDKNGLRCETRFEVLQRFEDETTLLRAIPLTGRTNQIRVHLWSLGLPIVGDPTYLRDEKFSGKQTLDVETEPMCLHSLSVEILHPTTERPTRFRAPEPAWASGANP